MAGELVEKKRKSKRSQLMKRVRWVKGQLYGAIFPTFRWDSFICHMSLVDFISRF